MFLHHVRSGVVFMGRHSIGQNAMLPIPISTIDILTKKKGKKYIMTIKMQALDSYAKKIPGMAM